MKRLTKTEIARIRAKGELTIPKRIREQLGWDESDHIAFKIDEDGRVVLEKLHFS